MILLMRIYLQEVRFRRADHSLTSADHSLTTVRRLVEEHYLEHPLDLAADTCKWHGAAPLRQVTFSLPFQVKPLGRICAEHI
jgi:hypothetical protein